MTATYQTLEQRFKKASLIGDALSILHWDNATMMPPASASSRGEQLACLDSLSHEILTQDDMNDLLSQAEENKDKLSDWQQRNLELMLHSYIHTNAVPADLQEALILKGTECEHVWRECKANNDFAGFVPFQQEVLELTRKIATVKAEALGTNKYDALLDQYDAGRKSVDIDKVFTDLKSFLPNFLQQVLDKQESTTAANEINGPFSVEKQSSLGKKLMLQLGFDTNQGRIDTSSHPFCGGHPDDIRITTRYDENDFSSALMGVLHETGHALYEMGLPKEWRNQPVGNALGMTIHESMSLFVEMQLCRSQGFIEYIAPLLKDAFGESNDWSVDNLSKIYNHVQPSLIRVDADEVTYPLHVILRYELEKDMINGNLEIADLPDAWNKKMQNYLGVSAPNFAQGCMQDIHWTDGAFGYFPTYTLGAMTAAQWRFAMEKDIPEIESNLAKGDFSAMVSWLRENVHENGSKRTADELLEHVTGEALNADIYKNHLKKRYLD